VHDHPFLAALSPVEAGEMDMEAALHGSMGEQQTGFHNGEGGGQKAVSECGHTGTTPP